MDQCVVASYEGCPWCKKLKPVAESRGCTILDCGEANKDDPRCAVRGYPMTYLTNSEGKESTLSGYSPDWETKVNAVLGGPVAAPATAPASVDHLFSASQSLP